MPTDDPSPPIAICIRTFRIGPRYVKMLSCDLSLPFHNNPICPVQAQVLLMGENVHVLIGAILERGMIEALLTTHKKT